jgi:hypothetical protein
MQKQEAAVVEYERRARAGGLTGATRRGRGGGGGGCCGGTAGKSEGMAECERLGGRRGGIRSGP